LSPCYGPAGDGTPLEDIEEYDRSCFIVQDNRRAALAYVLCHRRVKTRAHKTPFGGASSGGGLKVKFTRIAMALAAAGIIANTSALLADTAVTPAEAEKIKAALEAWGCSGGKMEKETEGSGYFEVDDAKCKSGQYDIKLDKDFNVTSMTRD
jgi:hypothetical protein